MGCSGRNSWRCLSVHRGTASREEVRQECPGGVGNQDGPDRWSGGIGSYDVYPRSCFLRVVCSRSLVVLFKWSGYYPEVEHLIRLTDSWDRARLGELFVLAKKYEEGTGPAHDGSAVLFFTNSSLRTRATFELGAKRMGLVPITFPPETLDKIESLVDVASYLAQWANILVVRHPEIAALEELASANVVPIVNGMTDENHPCEVLSDLYSLSQSRDIFSLRYLFVGADGNIGRAWREAATAFSLDLTQCCPPELAMEDTEWSGDLFEVVRDADIIITDGPGPHAERLRSFQVTSGVLATAPEGVCLSPCPPFVRGREVSEDAIESAAFVGYEFKRSLLPVQQAIMATCMGLT